MTKPRYDDQLFARCRKVDRRRAEKAARMYQLPLSEFIRMAVNETADKVLEPVEKQAEVSA